MRLNRCCVCVCTVAKNLPQTRVSSRYIAGFWTKSVRLLSRDLFARLFERALQLKKLAVCTVKLDVRILRSCPCAFNVDNLESPNAL